MRALDFAISRILPEDLRRETYSVDKAGLQDLLYQVALRYPDKYAEVTQKIGDLGRNQAWFGGYSTGPKDTQGVIDTSVYFAQMDAELDDLKKKQDRMSDEDYDQERSGIMVRYSDMIKNDTMIAALKSGNAFAQAVESGARGNPAHIQAILSTPGVFTDAQDKVIPMFVRNSYSSGVRPGEMLAGTYGSRKAVVATKTATAKGGDLGKITGQSTSKYNVAEKDCGVENGIDLEPDDPSLKGRVLAHPIGDFEAGTVIDRRVAARLRRQKKPIVARSTMTCQAENGVCSKCAGLDPAGKFYSVGDSLGVTAGQAIFEPVVQGSLNTKHNAGQASGKKSYAGLDVISQFVQVPSEFKDRAAVAEVDGMVESIVEAPQGGHFVKIGDENHYVLPGMAVHVKVGDKVEAGDIMSEGLASPADITRLRGLGEGRRYFAERFGQIAADSGQKPDARNMELFAKAAIDTFVVDDPDEESPFSPDERVRESRFLRNYTPPKDTEDRDTLSAVGGYLQKPTLHYTVGTRITPKMAERIGRAGIAKLPVSKTLPTFRSDMQRLRTASHDSRDWLESMGSSYLKTQMRDSVERGDDTNVHSNSHFGPRLAYGKGFGENIQNTGMF